jgi:hypothetical protein
MGKVVRVELSKASVLRTKLEGGGRRVAKLKSERVEPSRSSHT